MLQAEIRQITSFESKLVSFSIHRLQVEDSFFEIKKKLALTWKKTVLSNDCKKMKFKVYQILNLVEFEIEIKLFCFVYKRNNNSRWMQTTYVRFKKKKEILSLTICLLHTNSSFNAQYVVSLFTHAY